MLSGRRGWDFEEDQVAKEEELNQLETEQKEIQQQNEENTEEDIVNQESEETKEEGS